MSRIPQSIRPKTGTTPVDPDEGLTVTVPLKSLDLALQVVGHEKAFSARHAIRVSSGVSPLFRKHIGPMEREVAKVRAAAKAAQSSAKAPTGPGPIAAPEPVPTPSEKPKAPIVVGGEIREGDTVVRTSVKSGCLIDLPLNGHGVATGELVGSIGLWVECPNGKKHPFYLSELSRAVWTTERLLKLSPEDVTVLHRVFTHQRSRSFLTASQASIAARAETAANARNVLNVTKAEANTIRSLLAARPPEAARNAGNTPGAEFCIWDCVLNFDLYSYDPVARS